MKRHDLGTLFGPRSVAIVGASPNPTSVGGRIVAHLTRHAFPGEVHLVNPRHDEIAGRKVAHRLSDLPTTPDVAVVALPADPAVAAAEELAELGTRHVVLLASGFDQSDELRLAALAKTVNVVGPNSGGFWSVPHQLVLAFGSEAERDHLVEGPVAVVAHSGSLGGAVTRRLQDSGVGVRYSVSAGNEAGLTTADYLEYFLADGQVRVVALYVEAVREGQRLIPLLDRAHAAHVDVVVLQAGLSRQGGGMTASHTGRMASAPHRYAEIFTQHGALMVGSVRELVAAVSLLARTDRRIGARRSLGMLGISGGMVALMTDRCVSGGFNLPAPIQTTRDQLRQRLPEFAFVENPVDLTSAVLSDEASLPECVAMMAEDPEMDAVVVGLDNRGYGRVERGAQDFIRVGHSQRKPVVLALWDAPAARSEQFELALLRSGVSVAEDPSDVAFQLETLARRSGAVRPDLPATDRRVSPGDLESWAGQIDFARSLGLEVPATITVEPGTELSPADFERLAAPVVVKPLPSRVEHKSDRGLVLTGLATYEDAAAGVSKIAAAVAHEVPILVQRQVSGIEALLGVTLDPDWGPVLTVGSGGALVELLDDHFTVSIPCAAPDLLTRLRRLRLHRLLQGYRGKPEADVDALIDAALRLQAVMLTGRFSELELNPIIVAPRGQGAFMVDVLGRPA